MFSQPCLTKMMGLIAMLVLALAPFSVLAGPGGYISLVNYTPYDWVLKHSHQYQMEWTPKETIPAGTTYMQYVEWRDILPFTDNGDAAAEALYELSGSPVPARFEVQARHTGGRSIRIQYLDQLESLGHGPSSLLDLSSEWYGAVLFALSGDGTTPYVGGLPPTSWMQATLSTIGDKSLRQISMPLSHDAGMSSVESGVSLGMFHNTGTQSLNIFGQLKSGARWFDIRPFSRNGVWLTNHLTAVGTTYLGGAGQSIASIIDNVNSFTAQHPGELIVLELSHEILYDYRWLFKWTTIYPDETWFDLFGLLSGINDLWVPDDATFNHLPEDLSTVPLSTFIQPGSKSAVIILLQNQYPGAKGPKSRAFQHAYRFPRTGSYSDASWAKDMAPDQLGKLAQFRPSPSSPMLQSTWTITQSGSYVSDVANYCTSIVGMAHWAHKVLFELTWAAMSPNTYPNLIEVDDFNAQVTAMCMVINDRYANAKGNGRREIRGRDMVHGVRDAGAA